MTITTYDKKCFCNNNFEYNILMYYKKDCIIVFDILVISRMSSMNQFKFHRYMWARFSIRWAPISSLCDLSLYNELMSRGLGIRTISKSSPFLIM